MQRVFAHVIAALVVASAAVLLFSVGAFAQDNPGNHYGRDGNPGHHYGQLKHKTPPPTPKPTTKPLPGGTVATRAAGAITKLSLPDLTVTVTVPAMRQAQARLIDPQFAPDAGLDWLILVILPALAAVWIIALTRLALMAGRRTRKQRTVAAVPAAAV
jgi:hypothetical protein